MEATATKTTEEMEGEISRAMRARVKDFKEQADSLTLEGVRRALEKDLGMEKFSLDVQKKFIKQCLNECFMAADDECEPRTLETATKAVQPEKEASIQHEGLKPPESVGPALNEIELAGENKESQHVEDDSGLSEDKIRKALKKRAAYVRDNVENISLAEVRRLLEGDLNLEKNALDTYKGFIKKELDAALMSAEPVETTNGVKKRKKVSPTKETSRDSDSVNSNDDISNDEEDDEERRPKKRLAQKNKSSTKRIINDKKTMVESKSSARKKKPVDQDSDKCSESDDEKSSVGNHSNSSADESVKKKIEKPTQVYGKKVEHLKSIIRSCGLGIPPSIYKKVKQAPENKREAFLIKELQEILEREGLSTNPSEKEIKAVKKKKDRAKELEGIDMSNIVMSSRRRATSNYIPPPKPKVEVESDDEEEDEDNEDDEEDTDGDNDSGNSSEGSEDGEEESD